MKSVLDHLAIVAPTLEAGARFVRETLGVELQPGGAHPRMGTHNRVLRLGPDCYLEVIAIDPAAAKPDRSRWFGLDQLASDAEPYLATWMARTDDIAATATVCDGVLGDIEPMTRGELAWQITLPKDGSLPLQGAAPTLIQWQTTHHPASTMAPSGCTLVSLEILHPQAERVRQVLEGVGFAGDVQVLTQGDVVRLVAYVQTPGGVRRLG